MKYPHEKYMKIALQIAERGRFTVSPNPLVGCVLVKEGRIIASGWHQYAGGLHAECMAIEQATESTEGATAYITLEPCSHVGRTPPCAPRLIAAGVKAVYVATLDPNPLVNGQGIRLLEAAGILVHLGLCEKEAVQQNRIFFHFIKHNIPYVIAKWAMSLDGKTRVVAGDDRQLSSVESQQETHRLRQCVDAILIGSNTALQDDPLLTVRYQESILKHPIRIVLCGQSPLPFGLRLFDAMLPSETWIIVPHTIDAAWYEEASKRELNVIRSDCDDDGKINLPSLMQYLGTRNITSLLVEGGMSVLHSFFAKQLVHESHVFMTPFIIGELPKKSVAILTDMERSGVDYHLIATHEVTHV